MAERKRRDLLSSLNACLQRYRLQSKKLVAPFLNSSIHTSEPAFIDEEDLEKLQGKLNRIRATLKEAEKLAVSDECVKLWLSELRDIEYAAEDVLEVIRFESLRTTRFQELVSTSKGKRKREVSLVRFSPCSSLNIKINKIFEKFKEIDDDRKALLLTEEDGVRRPENLARPPTTSLSEGELFGRKEDVDKLVQLLTSDEPNLSIIPVVGMAGVGKTTLVQHVYNLHSKHFDEKIWICASQDFDVVNMTRTIIQAVHLRLGVREGTRDISELSLLQEILLKLVKGKRFLLVVDDVWTEDAQHWEMLQRPLRSAAPGSKIIVTTQNMGVAEMMRPSSPYLLLNCLSEEHCWLICRRHAFEGRDLHVHQHLVEIGKKIAAKCKGLPLAAKAVGCLLSSAVDEEQWENVLHSGLWTDNEVVNGISPALKLAYDRLPANLKRCFAYCSLFPKGYIYGKNQLVRLWIAQGFVESDQSSDPPLQIEKRGNKYFNDLAGRSFFQISPFYDFREERYVMHDLFQELAQTVSGNECSRTEDYKLCEISEGARHSSLVPQESHFETDIQLEAFGGQDLRTLLFIGRVELKLNTDPFHVNISSNLFDILKCLRTLDLSHSDISELPASIGSLIHLRYLSLRNTKIARLPESVCFLFNLQTLDLSHCCYLEELAEGAKHLLNLRHLELPQVKSSNICIASGIGQLTTLQTLPTFAVGSYGAGCVIGELGDLVNLRGELHISGLNNVIDGQDAASACMDKKSELQKLTLQWSSPNNMNGESVSQVLDRLRPHANLKVLTVRDFSGIRFPKWMGDKCFSKLVTVNVHGCGQCKELPPLGQLPCLKHLTVHSAAGLHHVGHGFRGSDNVLAKGFPVLEILEFKEMYNWEEWRGVEEGDFPCIRDLTISGCCKLKGLPQLNALKNLYVQKSEKLHQLPLLSSLEKLEIGDCKELASVGNLQDLPSLSQLEVTKCPRLHFSQDIQLPLTLKIVNIHGHDPLLSCCNPIGFERSIDHDQKRLKLARCMQMVHDLQFIAATDSYCASGEGSSWFENLERSYEDKNYCTSSIP